MRDKSNRGFLGLGYSLPFPTYFARTSPLSFVHPGKIFLFHNLEKVNFA